MVWTYAENEENHEGRAIVDITVPGKRPRRRLRGRWMDCVQRDMQELRVTPEDAQDRIFWKSIIRAADLTVWEKAKKKRKNYVNFLRCCECERVVCCSNGITKLMKFLIFTGQESIKASLQMFIA